DARWDENLPGVWSKIKSSLGTDNKQKVRPRSHWDTPPKEKEAGWVVEIRGSTNHETAPAFLGETFVEIVASIGIKAAPGAAAPADAKPEDKDKKNEGPVTNKISHVALLELREAGDDSGFAVSSELPSLVGGGGGGALGGPMAGPTL